MLKSISLIITLCIIIERGVINQMATAKPPAPSNNEMEAVKESLQQIVNKLHHAKVLNGGFDRLEKEVADIKHTQSQLIYDNDAQKKSYQRVEEKLDKIFDPETGLYSKFIKTETMLENLNTKVNSLVAIDNKIEVQLSDVEKKTLDNSKRLLQLKNIAGEDHEVLRKSIDISNGIWWLIAMTVTGVLGGIGKLIWDFFM